MPAAPIALLSRWTARAALLLALLGAPACQSVQLVGDYDPVLDREVMQLAAETGAFLGGLSVGSEEPGYAANADFYYQVRGRIAALRARAAALEIGVEVGTLTQLFDELQKQFDELEEFHQANPDGLTSDMIVRSTQSAMNRSFGAIIQYLVVLKRTDSVRRASEAARPAA